MAWVHQKALDECQGYDDSKKQDRELMKEARKRRFGLSERSRARRLKTLSTLRSGQTAWIHPGISNDDVIKHLDAWSMQHSRHCNPNLCSVLIMDEVTKISDVQKLTASLSGLWVMSSVRFMTHGHNGELLKYKEFC